MIRVLVLAASPVVRAGLQALLAGQRAFHVAARPFDPAALAADVDACNPDVAVVALDASDDDFDLSAAIPDARRAPAFVYLRDSASERWMADAVRMGARAVLPHDVSAQELVAAISAAAAGLTVLHLDRAHVGDRQTALALLGGRPAPDQDQRVSPLTSREIEVLQMLAGGVGNKTIARRLGISMHTVKYHVASIMSKLHASSRTEAVTTGVRQGLILL